MSGASDFDIVSDQSSAPSSATSEHSDFDEHAGFQHVFRKTISEETGTPLEDLVPSTCMADLGIDSLLGLTIADTLSEVFNTDIPSSLLMDNESMQDIELALAKALGQDAVAVPSASVKAAPAPATPASQPKPTGDDAIITQAPHSVSIALERAKVKPARKTLFLIPDGSGSAFSYASVAKLHPEVTVYGLNCPWRTNPLEMTRLGVTASQLAAKFVAEIRRVQPHGPYNLGGWSAGGIFAFEATRQLMEAGETVEKLVLIDVPNPVGLENPPDRMFEFFESAGVFGSMGVDAKKVPDWLRPHFGACIRILDGYKPSPLANAPPTYVVYARDGICKNPNLPKIETSPDDPREMLWLLHDRTDFKAEGWVSMLGQGAIKDVLVMDDVNHFTMMNEGPQLDRLRRFIGKDALQL
ncbi:Thioesterase [Ophiocordyceps sinensis CO18]|nr:Thioesterase [Ophiocordyceps sinensis CO18]